MKTDSQQLPDLFERYKRTVVPINVVDKLGETGCGSGFHIGDGYIVTAKHVVDQSVEIKVAGTVVNHSDVIHHPSDKVDLAIIRTSFSLDHYMTKQVTVGKEHIPKTDRVELGGHLDGWIGDEFILSSALLIGYPPIPFSMYQVPVAVYATVGAVVDRYDCPHPHFVLNTTARGGFSGGPVISEWGFLLGVTTNALHDLGKPHETAFLAAVSVEPLLELLHDKGIIIKDNDNILYKI